MNWLKRLLGVREYEPPYRWQELADYNSRVNKGIVHTPEYVDRMAWEQAQFNEAMRVELRADPNTILIGRNR